MPPALPADRGIIVKYGRLAGTVAIVVGGALAAAPGSGTAQDPGVPETHPLIGTAITAGRPGVTLTIGLQQDLDSPNVTAGYLVSSFELWNLQYATLTDKAADDFATIPGLAESWEGSDDGLTYTYTLREGLEWSDGTALTAEDIAYTVNRSRDEEWINHSSTTANLTATAIDARTVEIVSGVPDPKLPTMDVYIVPKHIYEPLSADDILTYDALDGVGSGPYTLEEWEPGRSWTMVANPSFYGWPAAGPTIDRIVFRLFENGDAMAAAIGAGEIDAAHNIPAESVDPLDADPDIVAVVGQQGGFSEIGINAGAGGIGDGHPALLDVVVRQAINKAINREALLERLVLGYGTVGATVSPSPDPSWRPEIPDELSLSYDPDGANQMLDDAGYLDTDDDGVREMPDGGRPLRLRYGQRSESEYEPALSEFVIGFLEDIGMAVEPQVYDDSALTEVIGRGNYDLFAWGWTPFVDPDPQLSYFTCDQVTVDPAEILYNDANWCSEEYDALYAEQNVELDPERRREIVHQMLLLMYEEAPYVVLFYDADLQAYRTDRFDGWVLQPSETGPALFSNTSPSYVRLRAAGTAAPPTTVPAPASTASTASTTSTASTVTGSSGTGPVTEPSGAAVPTSPPATVGPTTAAPTTAAEDDDGGGSGALIGIAIGAAVLVGIGAFVAGSRRSSRDDRE
ncbi:MAG: ABC transporter substrate-binding protein [Acidimicrobiia bacterium]|nr:ABC transporter substrate-binding protein [Acidimicrobiia bacterium]